MTRDTALLLTATDALPRPVLRAMSRESRVNLRRFLPLYIIASAQPRAPQRGGVDGGCGAAQAIGVGDGAAARRAARHAHAWRRPHRRDDRGVHPRVTRPAVRAIAGQDESAAADRQPQVALRRARLRQSDIELPANAGFRPVTDAGIGFHLGCPD